MNSRNGAELLECFHKATSEFELCPNRVWAVAGEKLPELLPSFEPATSRETRTHRQGHVSAEKHSHASCTFEFCEQSQCDFTSVKQRHECADGRCAELRGHFPRAVLNKAARDGTSTVWTLAGRSMLEHPRPYMAVSHVWSDGTGAGAWEDGQVNECLYAFFRDMAEQFECEGIWWDTICIPRDKLARNKAIPKIQRHYQDARITLVHDCFLRSWEWDPGTAGFAILMSPWFSRGWTALELANSPMVKVIFKGRYGPVVKDLDRDILSSTTGPGKEAADIIKPLRTVFRSGGLADPSNNKSLLNNLLQVLGPRHTSWPKDMAVIAALLTGVEPIQMQQDTYTSILNKIRRVAPGHLFHNAATMSRRFSWCPARLLSMPLADSPVATLEIVSDDGDLQGVWRRYCKPVTTQLAQLFSFNELHPLAQHLMRNALQDHGRCRLLAEPGTRPVRKALLVKETQTSRLNAAHHHQYIGSVFLRSEISENDWEHVEVIILGGDGDGPTRAPDRPSHGTEAATNMNPAALSVEPPPTNGPDSLCQAIWSGNSAEVSRLLETVSVSQWDRFGRRPLHLAAERGDEKMVSWLIERVDPHIELNMKCGHGRTALHRAAWGGSVPIAKILLGGSNAAATDKDGNLPLHMAARMGSEPVVGLLVGAETNLINAKGRGGLSPLHMAAMRGHEQVTRLLIENGADVNLRDRIGWTPLHYAAASGNEGVARELINGKSIIDTADGWVGWTPLHVAAMNGSEGTARLFLDSSPSADAKDACGWLPRHFADMNGHPETAELLAGADASTTEADSGSWTGLHLLAMDGARHLMSLVADGGVDAYMDMDGERQLCTPLLFAAEHGLRRVSQRLLTKDGNIELRNKAGRTALSLAAENGHDFITQLLLDRKAQVDARDLQCWTPLWWAAANCHGGIVEQLVRQGADIEAQDAYGQTPLLWAAANGHGDSVRLLLRQGADINCASDVDRELNYRTNPNGKLGYTPLWKAAENQHDSILRLLVDKTPNVTAKDISGETPLGWAAQLGYVALVRLLLEKGADANIKDRRGHRPLQRAVEKRHVVVVRHLLYAGADMGQSDGYRNGPLWRAMEIGEHAIAKLLVDRITDVNSFLSDAVSCGHDLVVRLLVEKGANINHRDEHRGSLLFWAASRGNEELTRILLENGSSLEDSCAQPSGLGHAALKGQELLVSVLLDQGADVNYSFSIINQHPPLWYAAENGHLAVVKLLLDRGADIDYKDKHGRTALWIAAIGGHMPVVHHLLEKGAAYNPRQATAGATLLSYAARHGHESSVLLLLGRGAYINTKNKLGRTPLWEAAEHGHVDIVNHLLHRGAKYDATQIIGDETLLLYAARDGNEPFVRLLLHNDANVNHKDRYGDSVLLVAARKRHWVTINLLIDSGADINIGVNILGRVWAAAETAGESLAKLLVDKGADFGTISDHTHWLYRAVDDGHESLLQFLLGVTTRVEPDERLLRNKLLWQAAKKGRPAIVSVLLDREADINFEERISDDGLSQTWSWGATTFPSATVVEIAVKHGHLDAVNLLLGKAADMDTLDRSFNVDVQRSALENGHLGIVSLLLDKGVGFTRLYKSPLRIAAENGHLPLVEFLLDRGADVNDGNAASSAPLKLAAKNGHAAVVNLLLRSGANCDPRHLYEGDLLLLHAARFGNTPFAQLLLDKGANVNYQDKDGYTALWMAVKHAHSDLVSLLLDRGAEYDPQWAMYRTTLLCHAARNGHAVFTRLLLDNDADVNFRDGGGQTPLMMAVENRHAAVVKLILDRGPKVTVSSTKGHY